MVLAAGPSSIEDVGRAPDDALCRLTLRKEVGWCANQRVYTHRDYVVPSIGIHTRLIKPEGPIHLRCNSLQINAGRCGYFQGSQRRACYDFG